MKCPRCGRELREDSVFCDQCGAKVEPQSKEKTEFNTNALVMGIIISVVITLLVTLIARSIGIPLIFGGLFLPFFWWRVKSNKGK